MYLSVYPASVYVQYKTQGVKKLKSQTIYTDESNNAEIILARLRPDSGYKYTVYAVSHDEASKPYEGEFNVNPLPSGIGEGIYINRLKGRMCELTIVNEIHGTFKGLMVLDQDGNVVWYRKSYLHDPVIGSVSNICRDSEFNFIRSAGKSELHPAGRLIVTDVFGKESEESLNTSKYIVFNKAHYDVCHEARLLAVPTDSIYGETKVSDDQD